jgi:hypothetical protein
LEQIALFFLELRILLLQAFFYLSKFLGLHLLALILDL